MTGLRSVLVTRAGSGAANNVIRSIRAGDATLRIVGCHDDPLFLKKSTADRNYRVPALGSPRLVDAYRQVVRDEGGGLIVPTTDSDVRELAQHRHDLAGCLFLPTLRSIDLCQDKYALVTHLRRLGVAAPATREVSGLDDLDEIVRSLRPNPYLWCRIRRGAGSFGALLIRTAAQARAWISYWEEMRGVPASAFIISEYLPGRDFACQTLWKNGIPILVKTTQRMAYVDGPARPSGTSSIGGVHRTVDEPRVAEVAAAAVLAVDLGATGAFSVDLKENAVGVPHVTEINAGRFLTGTTIFDSAGRHNMTATYVKLGLREPVHVDTVYDRVDETYMVRDLDALPDVFSREELLTGFIDLTGPTEEGGSHGVTAAERRFPVEDDEHRGAAAERDAGGERCLRG